MEQKVLRPLQMEQNSSDLNTATKKYTQKKGRRRKENSTNKPEYTELKCIHIMYVNRSGQTAISC
jgi:hypothetical protein